MLIVYLYLSGMFLVTGGASGGIPGVLAYVHFML
jgi:hypothetical protein